LILERKLSWSTARDVDPGQAQHEGGDGFARGRRRRRHRAEQGAAARELGADRAWARRYAAPWVRKMSATSTAGRGLARGAPSGAPAGGMDDYAGTGGCGQIQG
jgi:hypothetical protein